MKARETTMVRLLAAGAGLLLLAGCAILSGPKPDPTRYYVLSAESAPALAPAGAPVVLVRAVEVASYLRSRPLIVRRGDNEIEFREYALWGESLDQGVGRVLREELLARGAASAATPTLRPDLPAPDFQLTVRVLACEGAADGAVLFRAGWELTKTAVPPVRVAGGDFRATGLRWDGKTESSLAARLSEAVAGLAGEIAPALTKR